MVVQSVLTGLPGAPEGPAGHELRALQAGKIVFTLCCIITRQFIIKSVVDVQPLCVYSTYRRWAPPRRTGPPWRKRCAAGKSSAAVPQIHRTPDTPPENENKRQ